MGRINTVVPSRSFSFHSGSAALVLAAEFDERN
jgi:hypothetical protein